MMTAYRHIGVIPARKGSKGVPGKNRYLFGLLADFIRAHRLFDRVVVTSDDEELLATAKTCGFVAHRRPDDLASDQASIKQAFENLAQTVPCDPDDYLWLLFIPLVYRDAADFSQARQLIDTHRPSSLCSFKKAATHPFNCWRIDSGTQAVSRFVDNDYFNRQDYPEAWENYNYLSAVRVRDLARANANLITDDVLPVIMDDTLAKKMVEIDEPRDFEAWRHLHPEDYDGWVRSLPKDCPLPLKKD